MEEQETRQPIDTMRHFALWSDMLVSRSRTLERQGEAITARLRVLHEISELAQTRSNRLICSNESSSTDRR